MARQVTDEERERARRGGEWLRAERLRRGYETGTEFAAALGVKQGRLSSYENGNYLVEVRIANRIAELFDLPEVLVWHKLGLPLPVERRTDAEAIEWARAHFPEVMDRLPDAAARITGAKPPETLREPGRKPTRVTRESDKPGLASPGSQSAV